jgi:hypothetical protein
MNQIDLILENIRLGHINQLMLEATTMDEVHRGVALINESMQTTYGVLEEITKWKHEYQNLPNTDQQRIQNAKIPKSQLALANGINTGSNNIISKFRPGFNVNVEDSKGLNRYTSGGHYAKYDGVTGDKPSIYSPSYKPSDRYQNVVGNATIGRTNNPNIINRLILPNHKVIDTNNHNDLVGAINHRQDVYDAKSLHDGIVDKGAFFTRRTAPFTNGQSTEDTLIGNHNSAGVLANEAKLLHDTNYTSAAQAMKNYRAKTGEYQAINDRFNVNLNNLNNKSLGNVNRKIAKEDEGDVFRDRSYIIPR